MHTQKEIKNILERHFKEIADACKIEAALLNEAIFQMEDFSIAKQIRFSTLKPANTSGSSCIFRKTEAFGYIFGVGWQLEVADRNIKEIIRA